MTNIYIYDQHLAHLTLSTKVKIVEKLHTTYKWQLVLSLPVYINFFYLFCAEMLNLLIFNIYWHN